MAKLSFHAAFDAGVAALAGLSAGFVFFAMPAELFADLVAATQVASLVPAAQPPFGDTARLGASGGAAAGAFLFVLALMRLLGRAAQAARRAEQLEAPDEIAPRLRRADAHPDAPARAPISAGRDLGEPLELDAPLPAFLVTEEIVPEPAPAPPPQAEPVPLAELAAELPPSDPAEEQSLSQLVSRVESGFGRKRQALPAREPEPEPEPVLAPESAAEPEEKVGHRLRSAISELRNLSQAS